VDILCITDRCTLLIPLVVLRQRYTLNVCESRTARIFDAIILTSLFLAYEGDVGGQKTLRPYWRNYFERTDCIVWVVDSGDRERMQDCRDELWSLLGEERLAGATILVFANKQDIYGAMTGEEIQRLLHLDRISLHSWRIQPCSAVTGDNLLTGLDWAVKDVGSRIYFHGASHIG
jgi:ADP-ribosylation factor-like protein 2